MTPEVTVRRIRADEWAAVRALRLEAVSDPAAPLAFLHTFDEESAHDDGFWRDRAAHAAEDDDAAQFIAESDGRWVGSATLLLREPRTVDHHGRAVITRRADVVGVYLAPDHRGSGILGRLVDAAGAWAHARGATSLTLDVHRDNERARRAYLRLGFVPTGVTFTSTIGPEIEMRRDVTPAPRATREG